MSVLEALFDFSFNEFLTAKLVRFLYILSVILIAIAYLATIVTAFTQSFGQGLLTLIVGAIVALLTLAYVRVLLELIMVLFRIYENTRIMAGRGVYNPPQQASPAPSGSSRLFDADEPPAQ